MALEILQFPCLSDNYGYLIREPESGFTASIDTPEDAAINAELEKKGWRLTHILNTHHHFDHAGGNQALKARWNCTVVGAAIDRERIPGIDVALKEGEMFRFGETQAVVIEVPGHTTGHIAFHFPREGVAFVGDTLFVLGCGRLFEGTPQMMWQSLSKLMALPDETVLYCAHEYTQSNAKFAVTVEPNNELLLARRNEIDALRAAGKPTVPTTLAREKATNPFLRAASADLQKQVGKEGAPLWEVFGETRRLKDTF
ncbi:MAG: hydroxyacylglutathione hydrolase [Gammaproteobacteria bacterium]|nr:hydroxyacylglutathione hydrolase [Gammaproteobacteria bacterium]